MMILKFKKRIKISILLLCIFSTLISCTNAKKEKKEQIKIGSNNKVLTVFETGKILFEGKGNCYSCHQINKKSIGPSIAEIAKIYEEQNGDLIGFLKQQEDPIVDPENYAVMKTNFSVLKTFTDTELEAVVLYMEQVSKKSGL